MSDPFVGEIRRVSFDFAPRGWALCNGQILSISQNQVLFSLLGTYYGGNGSTNFALPDLRGRAPVHPGSQISVGESGGVAAVTLTQSQMPEHGHGVVATSTAASSTSPSGATWASTSQAAYGGGAPAGAMNPAAIATAGGSHAHENQPPYQVVNYIIALTGIYPSRG